AQRRAGAAAGRTSRGSIGSPLGPSLLAREFGVWGFPKPHGAVAPSGCNHVAVGRKRHSQHRLVMPKKDLNRLGVASPPNDEASVFMSGGEECSVGVKT